MLSFQTLYILTTAITTTSATATFSSFRLPSSFENWNTQNIPFRYGNKHELYSNSTESRSSTAYNYELLVCKDSIQELSCTNSTIVEDVCCFESPGGLILQAQFWDYNPSTGPSDAFTVHGLWPDNCDGTYNSFCNPDNEISNITQLIKSFSEYKLLNDMKTYWTNNEDEDEDLWEHEFNKHGTCYSTINPDCYGEDYTKNQEVIDYYKMTINLYHTLPTYQWLEAEGIVPSEEDTYTKDEILNALTRHYGFVPYIACDDNDAIDEVWYYFHTFGSLRNQNFQAIDTATNSTSCPDTGIKYLPKYSESSSDSASASTKTVTSVLTSSSTVLIINTSTKTITVSSTPVTSVVTYTTTSVVQVLYTSTA